MKKLIIHIGFSKTGSTSIQSFLKSNAMLLEELGVYYPLDNNRIDSYKIFSYLYSNNKVAAKELLQSYFKKCDTVLLSSEFIPNYAEDFGEIANFVDEVNVICFVRRQDLWFESAYQQFVKMQHNKKEKKAVKGISDTPQEYLEAFNKEQINWLKNIQRWENVFGKGSLTVKNFNKEHFKNSSLEEEFLDLIGIEEAHGFSFPITAQNESFSNIVTEMIRLHNSVLPEGTAPVGYMLFNEMIKHHHLPLEKPTFLDSKTRLAFLEYYRANNQTLCNEYLDISYDCFIGNIEHHERINNTVEVKELVPLMMGFFYSQHEKIEKLNERILKLESERK